MKKCGISRERAGCHVARAPPVCCPDLSLLRMLSSLQRRGAPGSPRVPLPASWPSALPVASPAWSGCTLQVPGPCSRCARHVYVCMCVTCMHVWVPCRCLAHEAFAWLSVCVLVCGVPSVCKGGVHVCACMHKLSGPGRDRLSARAEWSVCLKDSGREVLRVGSCGRQLKSTEGPERPKPHVDAGLGPCEGCLALDGPGRLSSGRPGTSLVMGADPRALTRPCPLCRWAACAVVLSGSHRQASHLAPQL